MDQPVHEPSATAPTMAMTSRRVVAVLVWALVLAVLFYFFRAFQVLFLGVLAAGCLAATLHPLMKYVPAKRAGSAVVVGLAPPLLAVGLIVLVFWLLSTPIQREVKQWPETETRMNQSLADWSNRMGLQQPLTVQGIVKQGGSFLGGSNGAEMVKTTTDVLSSVAIALTFVFFGSIFMLLESPNRLLDPVLRPLPLERQRQVRGALSDLVVRLRWWVLGTLLSMSIVFVAAWIGFAIVGLDFAFPLALLAGISEIVPTVGPAAAFLVAVLVAATQGTGTVIAVIVVYLIIQLLESYLIVPLVMKQAVKIPPVVTLFTVVLWGKVFGAAGLFLAIPINLVIWSLYDHLLVRPASISPADPAIGEHHHD